MYKWNFIYIETKKYWIDKIAEILKTFRKYYLNRKFISTSFVKVNVSFRCSWTWSSNNYEFEEFLKKPYKIHTKCKNSRNVHLFIKNCAVHCTVINKYGKVKFALTLRIRLRLMILLQKKTIFLILCNEKKIK